MYISSTFKRSDVHIMYMKRPNIPEDIYYAVENEARSYEKHWRETLERILEQEAEIEIKPVKEVEA